MKKVLLGLMISLKLLACDNLNEAITQYSISILSIKSEKDKESDKYLLQLQEHQERLIHLLRYHKDELSDDIRNSLYELFFENFLEIRKTKKLIKE